MALSRFQKVILTIGALVALFILLVGEKDAVTCYQDGNQVESIINGKGLCVWKINVSLRVFHIDLVNWNTTYEGEWKNGRQDGYGKYISVSQCVYDGQWLNGTRHGKGSFDTKDGTRWTGEWVADELTNNDSQIEMSRYSLSGNDRCPECTSKWSQAIYKGPVLEAVMHGAGIISLDNGIKIKAEFHEGQILTEGGKIYLEDQTVDIINLESSRRIGHKTHYKGSFRTNDGTVYNWDGHNLKKNDSNTVYLGFEDLNQALHALSCFEFHIVNKAHMVASAPFDFFGQLEFERNVRSEEVDEL